MRANPERPSNVVLGQRVNALLNLTDPKRPMPYKLSLPQKNNSSFLKSRIQDLWRTQPRAVGADGHPTISTLPAPVATREDLCSGLSASRPPLSVRNDERKVDP